MVQCHCSIPTPPVPVLQDDPRLGRVRAWIGAMQVHFIGYPHCYSGTHFDSPIRPPQPAVPRERAAFWAGLGATVLLSPITLPIIALLAWRVRRR